MAYLVLKILNLKSLLYRIIKKFFIIIAISAIAGNISITTKNHDFYKTYEKSKNLNQITGIIISQKEEKEYYDKYILKAKTKGILNRKYIIYARKGMQEFKYGEEIRFNHEYIEPEEARNYKGFNYKEYLKTKNVYGSFRINDSVEILANNKANKLSIFINNIREQIIKNVHEVLPEEQAGILLGIILGEKNEIPEKQKEDFKLSNMMHILSVSGMHTSYIILGLTYILNNLPKRKKYILIIFVLLLFMALTNFSPSVVRAIIMASMFIIAKLIYRKSDFLTSIFLSLLILLIYNPFLINDIGLQLSFLGTLGIAFFSKEIINLLERRTNKKVAKILGVSLSAQILILPILVYNFNTLSLSFLLSCFVSSIFAGIIFISGIGIIIISFLSLKISKKTSLILKILINILSLSAEKIADFKLLNYTVKTPIMLEVMTYYLLFFSIKYIFIVFHKDKQNLRRYEKRMINKLREIGLKKILYVLIIIVSTFITTALLYRIIPKELKIYFIDVGQGDGCLIKTPRGKTILIDGGEDEDLVLDYLLDRRITKLDYIIISHFDSDHVRWNF